MYSRDIVISPLESWGKVPQLKIAEGGNFQFGYLSYLFQRIKQSIIAKFHAIITIITNRHFKEEKKFCKMKGLQSIALTKSNKYLSEMFTSVEICNFEYFMGVTAKGIINFYLIFWRLTSECQGTQ